ncbi:16S rRNA (cytidine(1402)-2'-O)-methyltransferase [Candidatus Hepatincolaceae symbiont of Richtersius coronifer]
MYTMAQLYIISTPIGNLDDITLRAIKILNLVDIVVCEDTRISKKLLNHLQISKPLISYNNYNEQEKTQLLSKLLLEGKNIGLISDAGTPLISDPGFLLIRECYAKGIVVTTAPGPCSIIAALVLSGLPLNRFLFLGFLNKSSLKKQELFKKYQYEDITLAFFESPHRILNTLQDLAKIFPKGQEVVIAKELTKLYEEIKINTLDNLIAFYQTNKAYGELVILIKPKLDALPVNDLIAIIKSNLGTLNPSDLAKKLAKEFNTTKNIIYEEILKLK